MSQQKSFLLVPNHSYSVADNAFFLESAESEMLRFLKAYYTRVGVSAFKTSNSNTSLSGRTSVSEFFLHSLNVASDRGNAVEKIANYLYTLVAAPFIIKRYRFVYIFCPGYCGMILGLWSIALGIPYGLYVRGTWEKQEGKTPRTWKTIFKRAKFMIVTGEAFKEALSKYCDLVENEVPLTKMRPEQIKIKKDYRSAVKRIIFAGRISESKGILDVVKAISLLKNNYTDIKLLVAGGGTDAEKLKLSKLIAEQSLENQVEVLGHVSAEDLAKHYRECGIFVFPSYFAEGFPRVLYEAMMHGCSIVTCDMPGTEGFLVNGINCLTTPPSSPIYLARNLENLLKNPSLSEALALQAKIDVDRVYNSFKESTHAEQLQRLINC